jgi:hypothetical protein
MTFPYSKEAGGPRWRQAVASVASAVRRTGERLAALPGVRRVIPALSVVTGFGWAVLLLAILAWYYGRQRHWMELVGFALILGVAWLAALAWTIGRVSYKVDLTLASNRVIAGETAVGELTVANAAGRACPSSIVEVPVGATIAQFGIPVLAGGGRYDEIFTVPTHRRGIIPVGPVMSVRGDGLGLLRREQVWVERQDLYVHPKTVNVGSSSIGFIRDIEGATTHDLSSNDVAFHALRDYIPGDDRRNVHWKTTARIGKLMVRQFEETRRAHLLIIFDDDAKSWASESEYELGISVAASVGVAVLRERRELSFISQIGPLHTSSPRPFLDGLTVLSSRPGLARLRELARVSTDKVPNASVIVMVTGSMAEVADIHRAYAMLPVNARNFALRADELGKAARSLVAGLPVVTVPRLDDLPLALRKAVI